MVRAMTVGQQIEKRIQEIVAIAVPNERDPLRQTIATDIRLIVHVGTDEVRFQAEKYRAALEYAASGLGQSEFLVALDRLREHEQLLARAALRMFR